MIKYIKWGNKKILVLEEKRNVVFGRYVESRDGVEIVKYIVCLPMLHQGKKKMIVFFDGESSKIAYMFFKRLISS